MQRSLTRQRQARRRTVSRKRATRSILATKKGEARLFRGLRNKVFGFPNTLITKLRYADTFAATGTTGARAINVYAANGIYDPDITGVGHQPLYRDNFANIYDQYVVLGSKITASFYPTTSTAAIVVGIIGDDDSSVTSTVSVCMEQSNSVSALLGTAGCPPVTLTRTYSALEHIGVRVKDDGYSATAQSSNPTELWCYGLWAAAADGVSTITVNVKFEIEYTVKYTELATQPQS